MIDIKEQVEFNFTKEDKNIVITNNMDNVLVKELNTIFDNKIISDFDEGVRVIHTLGKMKAEKIYIVNFSHLKCKCKREKVFKSIANIKENSVVLVDTFQNDSYETIMQEMAEKLLTENYKFTKLKSKPKTKDKDFFFYGETKIYDVVKKGFVYGEMINKCRDLVNTPYNYLNATDLANYAKKLERYENIEVRIYDKAEIEEMNMGAFLGVNKGSLDEPKLISVKYKGKAKYEDPVALVGKGVMYDTGGYSLKTPVSMPGMKVDMAGAAAVISAIEAIAKLKLEANVMAIVAATDNRIGDGAIVPDDVLTSANGQTIEIISTDAEGRLTLADAVWFAQKEGAKKIIDTATLTGAMVAALGFQTTGAFTNNKEFLNKFISASEKTNEHVWHMPITKEYRKELKSKVADMTNKGGRYGGASIAAAFIEKFIDKDTKWIHLDIAGTSVDKKTGATGVMVKTFTEFFM
jgi:leucyl aminopeptidase